MAPEISEIATALGDENARKIGEIFAQHRDRLKQLVEAKLAARPDVRRRFDADDVLQEAFFVINRRFAAFDAEPTMDLFAWLWALVHDQLLMHLRQHSAAKKRTVAAEVYAAEDLSNSASSLGCPLANLATDSTPSRKAVQNEAEHLMLVALESLPEMYRRIVELRSIKGLSIEQAAAELGITKGNASKQYQRALPMLVCAIAAVTRAIG
jgi:RNA polymerase sigma-70 factor (subfamily 1)